MLQLLLNLLGPGKPELRHERLDLTRLHKFKRLDHFSVWIEKARSGLCTHPHVLHEIGRAICSSWSLKVEIVKSFLAVKAGIHIIFPLLNRTRARTRTFTLVRSSSFAERLFNLLVRVWVLLLMHDLSNEEVVGELFEDCPRVGQLLLLIFLKLSFDAALNRTCKVYLLFDLGDKSF